MNEIINPEEIIFKTGQVAVEELEKKEENGEANTTKGRRGRPKGADSNRDAGLNVRVDNQIKSLFVDFANSENVTQKELMERIITHYFSSEQALFEELDTENELVIARNGLMAALDQFTAITVKANAFVDNARKDNAVAISKKDREIADLKQQLFELNEKYKELHVRHSKFEDVKNQMTNEKFELQDKIAEFEEQYEVLKEQLKVSEAQNKVFVKEQKNFEIEKEKLQKELSLSYEKYSSLESSFSAIFKEKESELKELLEMKNDSIATLKESFETKISTAVGNKELELRKEFAKELTKVKNEQEEIKNLKAQLEAQKNQVFSLEKK